MLAGRRLGFVRGALGVWWRAAVSVATSKWASGALPWCRRVSRVASGRLIHPVRSSRSSHGRWPSDAGGGVWPASSSKRAARVATWAAGLVQIGSPVMVSTAVAMRSGWLAAIIGRL